VNIVGSIFKSKPSGFWHQVVLW